MLISLTQTLVGTSLLNTLSFVFSDNANTRDVYKYLRKPSKLDCYSAFQVKATNFFVSQVNDKAFTEKVVVKSLIVTD